MSSKRPIRASTKWKQQRSDALATETGMRFCMCCRSMKPTETVKRYPGVQRNVLLRCDSCQEKRLAAMRAAKQRKASLGI